MNKIDEYIKEIVSDSDSDIVAVDKKDIDTFVEGNDIIDGEKIVGTIESIFDTLEDTMNNIIKRNKSGKCNTTMLFIKVSEGNDISMENLSKMTDILSKSGEDVDVLWGMSTQKGLKSETLELILLVGFETGEKRIFQSFLNNLKKISNLSKDKEGKLTTDDYASIGSDEKTRDLIKELCDEIDYEYEMRRELSKTTNSEEWFNKKCDETLDDLASAGIIDKPSEEDYQNYRNAQKEAMENDILYTAKALAKEMNGEESEVSTTNKNEEE